MKYIIGVNLSADYIESFEEECGYLILILQTFMHALSSACMNQCHPIEWGKEALL